MTSDQLQWLCEIRDKLRPKDLNFRPECGDYKCGASVSWEEGFDAAVELLMPVLEEFKNCSDHLDNHPDAINPGTYDYYEEAIKAMLSSDLAKKPGEA